MGASPWRQLALKKTKAHHHPISGRELIHTHPQHGGDDWLNLLNTGEMLGCRISMDFRQKRLKIYY